MSLHLYQLKLVYFSLWASSAVVVPLTPLFFSSIGFSYTYIGSVLCIAPFIRLVGAPLFTAIADRTNAHKPVFCITLATAAAVRLSLLFIHQKQAISAVYILAEFISSATMSFVDSACWSILGEQGELMYGRQRLWASVGWGVFALINGWFVDWLGKGVEIIFYAHLILTVLVIVIVLLSSFPFAKDRNESLETFQPENSFWQWVWNLANTLATPSVFAFLFLVLLWGFLMGFIFSFTLLYMSDVLHSSNFLMGVLLATTCVAELPFFFYSGAITEYFGSFGVMIIAISCLSIRLGVYSIANAGYQVVLVDSLHGISFGSGWGAMSGFVNKYSPRGAESTMQGILQATSMGLGVGIGSIVSGFLYDGSGPVNMFRYGSYIGLFPLFSYSIYVFYQQISKIWNNVRPKISHNPKLESVHGHYEAIPALNEN